MCNFNIISLYSKVVNCNFKCGWKTAGNWLVMWWMNTIRFASFYLPLHIMIIIDFGSHVNTVLQQSQHSLKSVHKACPCLSVCPSVCIITLTAVVCVRFSKCEILWSPLDAHIVSKIGGINHMCNWFKDLYCLRWSYMRCPEKLDTPHKYNFTKWTGK